MKIDFHTHGKLAKTLLFSEAYTDWLFSEAKAAGLDAICLTEHFNTQEFDKLYGYIRKNYEQKGDAFLKNGLKIFPGMEVDIAEGGHTLVIGSIDTILTMNQELEPYKVKGHFMTMEQLSEFVSGYPVIFGAAHPFRAGSRIPELPEELLKHFMFSDCNGKDVAIRGLTAKREVEAFVKKLDIPMIAGSDTHQNFQYGCVYNIFEKDCDTVEELFEEMKKDAYEIWIASDAALRVRAAATLKKALKEVNALGGDYTALLMKPIKEEAC